MISLKDKILIFFSVNTDESLRRSDIADKFDGTAGNVDFVTKLMVKDGLLSESHVRIETGQMAYEYTAGPVIEALRVTK